MAGRTVVCSLCSQQKSDTEGKEPAIFRYTSERIRFAATVALQKRLPLYFLSGLHGFIRASTEIAWYDHILGEEGVDDLVEKVMEQLVEEGIVQVYLYTESETESTHRPYEEVMEKACAKLGISLHIYC